MDAYHLLRLIHILSAAVLSGSGAAIAFFMLMAWRSRNRAGFALAARHVVLADWLFTATAVVVQPVSGLALAHVAGWPLMSPWLLASVALYLFIGACWLPVVWIQYRVRNLLLAAGEGDGIPAGVDRLMRVWFALGWPAFAALIGIYVLMVWRPDFAL